MRSVIDSNIPNLIMMVRPKHFGFNEQTANSNSFQHNEDGGDVASKAIEEFNAMVDLLRKEGVQVQVIEDQNTPLPDAVFPNNWISHIPQKELIIYPMLTENRRSEVRSDIIDWCNSTLQPTEIIDLRASIEEEVFLEGTGSIVFDHENRLAYACVSPRTNLQLLKALVNKIGYSSVSFESLDLKGQQIYHTNVMMSVGSKVVLVCLESLPNALERMMLKETIEKTGKKILELSYAQINAFAGNALEVANSKGQKFVVMSKSGVEMLSSEQLNLLQEDTQLIIPEIPTFEKIGGGSVRCMMAGFFDYPK